MQKTEPRSFQWCPVARPEGMGPNWNSGGFIWTSGNILLWEWPHTGCPEMLCSLLPRGYSKVIWTWPCATISILPCLSRGFRKHDLQRPPLISGSVIVQLTVGLAFHININILNTALCTFRKRSINRKKLYFTCLILRIACVQNSFWIQSWCFILC